MIYFIQDTNEIERRARDFDKRVAEYWSTPEMRGAYSIVGRIFNPSDIEGISESEQTK